MISGIGIDTVAIDRFKKWLTFSDKQLSRIFTTREINYCNKCPIKKQERLAARFAAKEAFYKAYSTIINTRFPLPFLTFCKVIEVINKPHPTLNIIDTSLSKILEIDEERDTMHISITHTHDYATALVLIERR